MFASAWAQEAAGKAATAPTPTTLPTAATPAPSQSTPLPALPATTAITFMSWNLRDCAARDPGTGKPLLLHDAIAWNIASRKVDIAIFQEVQADSHSGGDIGALGKALAAAAWAMPYVAVLDAKGEDDLAVFSRYPIESWTPVASPAAGDLWPRPGLRVLLNTPLGTVEVCDFHFKAMGDGKSESARKAQALAAVRELFGPGSSRPEDRRVVLAGDLNTANPGDLEGPDSTLGLLVSLGTETTLDDLYPVNDRLLPGVPTYRDDTYESVLDHMLLSPLLAGRTGELQVEIPSISYPDATAAEPGDSSPGSAAGGAARRPPVSDHAPVVVRIPLPLKPPLL